MTNEDKFNLRVGNLVGGTTGVFYGRVETTQPIFVTLDAQMAANTYKEELQIATAPLVTLDDTDYNLATGNNRFTFMGRIHSYLNGSILDIYYDLKYRDIIFVPNLDYATVQPAGYSLDCYCFRLGFGEKNDSNMSNKLVLPTTESTERGRCYLPAGKKLKAAKVRMVSFAGMQHAGVTQDANTYEEMLDQAINLKRSQRNMCNFLELGTVNEVFDGNSVPTYMLHQISPRTFDYKYLGVINPGNSKLYVPLPF